MIQLLIVNDEPLLIDALSMLMSSTDDISPVAFCSEYSGLVSTLGHETPDVILITLTEPRDWSLVDFCRRHVPQAKIVLWVQDITVELAYRALETGVFGLLRRSLSGDSFLRCIRNVHRGELWYEKALGGVFSAGRSVKLSPRESQLVGLLSQGLKNKEIATALSITERTVKGYLSLLFKKVGAKDRFELALFALRNLQFGDPAPSGARLTMYFASSDKASTNASPRLDIGSRILSQDRDPHPSRC